MIGSELAGLAGLAAGELGRPVTQATIVAGAALAERYEAALAFCGIAAGRAPDGVAARGLARIAAAAGIA